MSSRITPAVALVTACFVAPAWGQGMATPDRVSGAGFWPTKSGAWPGYVGAQACAKCHPGPGASQRETSMARTLTRAADSSVLREHDSLRIRLAGLDYAITTRDGDSILSVSNQARSLSLTLGWAFGAGRVGQTFVYQHEGTFYESRVSYLAGLAALGFTPKRALDAPHDLEEAAGRPIGEDEVRRCFGCHTTAAARPEAKDAKGPIDAERLIPGVTCEACHGPGASHVAIVEQDRVAEIPHSLLRPSRFDPFASVDFCGACHGTWWDVTLAREKGIAALRSQPFRLQSSRCWGEGDSRLTCTACHDPHRPLERDPARYDVRCMACHQPASAAAGPNGPRSCRIATRECVTCHMPKYQVPEMHYRFTDHQIRVVREPRQP